MEVVEVTDPRAWDARVEGLGGHPLQCWAWGELKQRFGWRPLRLVGADGAAAAQVLLRSQLGMSVAYVPRGPVFSDGSVMGGFMAGVERRVRRQRAAFLRLEPDLAEGTSDQAVLSEILARRGYRLSPRTVQPRASLMLDVSRPAAEIWTGVSKGHRADVRRAEREGVEVRAGDVGDAGLLHEMLRATQKRKSFGIHSAGYFATLLEVFGDAARLFVAQHQGRGIAATLALGWGGRGVYLAAGSNSDGLRLRAGHLLQWHAIQWVHERGARTYDLWGIPDARARLELTPPAGGAEREALEHEARADPLDGVFRFKKGWGATSVRMLPAHDAVYFPPAYWLWQRRRGSAG